MAFFYFKQPRKFNYRPIFYDEDKEMHDELVANAKKELGIEEEKSDKVYRPQIKGSFRGGGDKISFNFKRREAKKSNFRLVGILGLLLLLGYLFFIR